MTPSFKPNPSSSSRSVHPIQLISTSHSLGLILGNKLDIPTHLIPQSLLLLSPTSAIIYLPFFFPIDKDKLDTPLSSKYKEYQVLRSIDSFIQRLKKEVKGKYLEVDPSISHRIWEKIYPHLKKFKNWSFNDPAIQFGELKKQYIQNHSQAEMAFIYACSYIKSGVGIEEIRFQIHDYLQSKTLLKGEVYSQVICRSLKIGKKKLAVLNPPALIHFQIELRENGVSSHFFKSVGLVDPLKKKTMKTAVTRYQDTYKKFMNIIKKITSNKSSDLVWRKSFPHLFKNEQWQLFTRSIAIDPGFYLIEKNHQTCFRDGEIHSLCLKDHKYGIIMGVTLIVNKNRIEVLEKYGWDYLQFPW